MNKYIPNSSTTIAILMILIAISLLISHFYPWIALIVALFSPVSAIAIGFFVTWWYKEKDNIWKG